MDSIPTIPEPWFWKLEKSGTAGKAAEGVIVPLARVNVGDLLSDNQPQKKVIMEYKRLTRRALRSLFPRLAAMPGMQCTWR